MKRNSTDEWGEKSSPPLIHAARLGNLEFVKMLVEKGADTHAFRENEEDVLVACIRDDRVEILRYVLECGVDVSYPFVASRGKTNMCYIANHRAIR